MARRSKSSDRWLREHFSDPFVKRAQAEGWRSRAVFKLEEIDQRERLLKPGMLVLDLGPPRVPGASTPAGWAQAGRVVATDLLPMEPLAGVEFLQGDFREERCSQQLKGASAAPGWTCCCRIWRRT